MSKQKKKRKVKKSAVAILLFVVLLLIGAIGYFGWKLMPLLSNKYVLVLDAGHDIQEKGYQGAIEEYDYTSAIIAHLYPLFEENKNIEVILTHEAEQALPVANRLEEVEKKNPDLMLSIHASYDPNKQAEGMRILTQLPSNPNYEQSVTFAKAIESAFQNDTHIIGIENLYYIPSHNNRDTVHYEPLGQPEQSEYATMDILQSQKIPTVVIEGLNINNPDEVAANMSEERLQEVAKRYYQVLLEILLKEEK